MDIIRKRNIYKNGEMLKKIIFYFKIKIYIEENNSVYSHKVRI